MNFICFFSVFTSAVSKKQSAIQNMHFSQQKNVWLPKRNGLSLLIKYAIMTIIGEKQQNFSPKYGKGKFCNQQKGFCVWLQKQTKS